MADTFKGIITADGKKRQLPYGNVLETPVSDKTLSVQGAFADAKAVGDKFAETDDKITQVKSDVAAETSRATAAEDTKADKTALARTDRSLDALWKLNKGVSYEFQKDETVAYQKDIPNGAKLASVEKIGGRTIVWNQMVQNGDFSLNSMWSGVGSTVSVEGNTGIFTATEAALTNNKIEAYQILSGNVVKGHKYCVRFEYNLSVDINDQSTLNLNGIFTKIPVVGAGTWGKFNSIVTVNVVNDIFDLYFYFDSLSVGDTVKLRNVQLFDLTRMFGTGNEPFTPEEFEAMFPADYYPYNEGELLSMPVNEVAEQGRNLLNPEDIVPIGFFGLKGTNENGLLVFKGTSDTDTQQISIRLFVDKANSKYDAVGAFYNGKFYGITGSNDNYDAGNGIVGKAYIFYFEIALKAGTQYELMFYPFAYKAGSAPSSYSPYHSTTHAIPQSILSLDGYGDGVTTDVYNYIDWENKKYHKRVGKVDLGTVNMSLIESGFFFAELKNAKPNTQNAICNRYKYGSSQSTSELTQGSFIFGNGSYLYIKDTNYTDSETFNQSLSGVMLYYELAEEQITDISDLIGDTLQEPIEVEADGSLTFRNTHGDNYRVSVPNTVEYTVKLSEVAK